MQDDEFRLYLKRRGKKSHVIDGLVSHVVRFEQYLRSKVKKSLVQADSGNLEQFIQKLEDEQPGLARKHCRGIALYYELLDHPLHRDAAGYRGAAISKTRPEFPLKKFMGVDMYHVERLAGEGITTAPQMLETCRTATDRKALAKRAGIPQKAILELARLSDLTRIRAVRGVRARLYYNAGIDAVEKMAQWKPEKLREHVAEYIRTSGFSGIVPQPKEIQSTIDDAKKLKPALDV